MSGIEIFDFDTAAATNSRTTRNTAFPHYTAETQASVLPEFSNFEQDRVKDAFRSTTFQVLSKLPTTLKPNAVAEAAKGQLTANVASSSKPAPSHKNLRAKGMFHAFEYLPSEYSLERDLAKVERLEGQRKMANVAGGFDERTGESYFEPFEAGHQAASSRLKYQANFSEPQQAFTEDREGASERARFPYVAEPFEAAKEARLKAKAAHEAKVLGNPASTAVTAWVPSGKRAGGAAGGVVGDGPLSGMPLSRKLLPDMVKELHGVLVKDWAASNFSVHVDESDALVVRFELRTIDSMQALMSYMNTLATDTSGALPGSRWFARYRMRRAMEAWPVGWSDHHSHSRSTTPGETTRASSSKSSRRRSSSAAAAAAGLLRGEGGGSSGGGGGRSNSSSSSSSSFKSPSSLPVEEPGWCAFLLTPPWRHRHTPGATFQALHPRSRTYRPRRGMPGSDFKPTSSYGPSLLSRTTGGLGAAATGGGDFSRTALSLFEIPSPKRQGSYPGLE
jgi:hypothetical protein